MRKHRQASKVNQAIDALRGVWLILAVALSAVSTQVRVQRAKYRTWKRQGHWALLPVAGGAILDADRNTISKAGELQSYPCAVDIIYKGAMVCINASGYAAPAADTAGYSDVVGVATEKVDNSGGSAGDLSVRVQSGRRFNFVATAIVQGDVGRTMYVVDDQTMDQLPGVNSIVAGMLTEFVSATAGYIHITAGGQGFPVGVGAAVTQITNRTTGVTINAISGTITTDNTSLAAEGSADFIVTNNMVNIGDVVVLSIQSGEDSGGTVLSVQDVAAGSFTIRVHNGNVASGTAETGAILINFRIIKATSA